MSFADNLRTLRKEKNMSQEHLAELLDVSRQAVSKWEQGTGYPEMEKMILLSKELNVSIDFLLSANKDSQLQLPTGSEDQSLVEKYSLRSERVLKIIVLWCFILVFAYFAGYAIGQGIGYLN